MSEVKQIRTVLERLRREPSVGGTSTAGNIAEAIVSEGLAACDAMPPDRLTGGCCYQIHAEARLEVFSDILRKAGLLK